MATEYIVVTESNNVPVLNPGAAPGSTVTWVNQTSSQVIITFDPSHCPFSPPSCTLTLPPKTSEPGTVFAVVSKNTLPGTYPYTSGSGSGTIVVVGSQPANVEEITFTGSQFVPSVNPNDTILWINNGGQEYRMTDFDPAPPFTPDPPYKAPKNGSVSCTVNSGVAAGTFNYKCKPSSGNSAGGIIIVDPPKMDGDEDDQGQDNNDQGNQR